MARHSRQLTTSSVERDDRQDEDGQDPAVRCQGLVLLRRENEVGQIGRVQADEQRALPAGDPAAGEEDRQAGQRDRDHYRQVEGKCRGMHRNAARRDQTGNTQHAGDVEDIAAHHVADCDIALTAHSGHQGRRDFRKPGADGDDGQTDEQFAHAEMAGEGDSRLDQPVGAEGQQAKAGHDEQGLDRPVVVPGFRGAELGGTGLFRHLVAAPALADDEHEIGSEQPDEQQAVMAGDHAVGGQRQQEQREADHHRHSWRMSWLATTSGRINAEAPRISRMFMILLPTTLPRAMFARSVIADCTDTASSGALVPKATTWPDHQRRDAEGQRKPVALRRTSSPRRRRPGLPGPERRREYP